MNWPSYEEWADKAVSIETREQPDFCIDIYVLPNGDHVRHDSIMPRHWARRAYTRAMLCGVQLPKAFKPPPRCELWDSYTEKHMGIPVFVDEGEEETSLRDAYEFARSKATTDR